VIVDNAIIFPILLVCEGAYIAISRRFGFRNGHRQDSPVTGGGIIFILAVWIYVMITSDDDLPLRFGYVAASATALAVLSFIDDMHPLSPWLRLLVQIATTAIPLIAVPAHSPSWLCLLLYIPIGVAFINAYNFMDGINGMTAAYSIVTLISIGFFSKHITAMPGELSAILFVAATAFGFYNFRRRELCHCGDVGSIVMGFMVLYLVSWLIYSTHDFGYIALVCIYIIDAGYTLIYRLYHGQNIMKGHRLHLYQLLDSRKQVPHLYISSAYAAVQLAINTGLLLTPDRIHGWYATGVFIAVTALYCTVRHRICHFE